MKFEYDTEVEEDRECVAFMYNNTLYVKDRYGKNVILKDIGCSTGSCDWETILCIAEKKFYKGDKITITF